MSDSKITTIGCFRILSDLKTGSGSQGAVYKAVCEREGFGDVKPGTVVALKVMVVQDGANQYGRLEERTAELKALAHPNVVRYHGCFQECDAFSDIHVVVLEFLDGASLKDILHGAPRGLDADETLRIAGQALEGLRYLSSRGIVHRDIKPGNIFVCTDGSVKLIDFEVARRDGGAATTVGGMVGTYDYMAPDFVSPTFRGDEVSDVFSFAVTLHEMLTGRTPYRVIRSGDTQSTFAFMSRWSAHSGEDSAIHVSARVRRILAGADEVLTKALAPERAARYQTFEELAKDYARIRFRELTYGSSRWQLLLHIGRGGFGEVFKAKDVKTGRLVAIKHLLHVENAERFRREARIMSEVKGPHFVNFVTFFELNGKGTYSAFLVMEYLPGMPGRSLRDAIKAADGESLPRRPVLHAFLRYARALSALHERGLVHRDIKPSNLYFPASSPERSAIMDFGIARDASGTATAGQMPGTLDYMPPESIDADYRGDAGMDVYALGLCLYEALSGRTAYPRIPQGQAGLKMFFERAQAKKPPKLDATSYSDSPELVSLLLEMTEPIASKRLRSAAEVERRIACILGLASSSGGRQSEGFVAPDDEAVSFGEEPATSKTVVADAETIALLCDPSFMPEPKKHGTRAFMAGLAVVVAVVALGGAVAAYVLYSRQVWQRKVGGDGNVIEVPATTLETTTNAEQVVEQEREAVEAAEREREEQEREAAELERREREAAEAAERERKEQERKAAEAAELERRERDAAEAAERERKEQERKAAEAAEKERVAREVAEKAERERVAAEKSAAAKARAAAELAEKRHQDEVKRRRIEEAIAKVTAEYERKNAEYSRQFDEAKKPGSRVDAMKVRTQQLMCEREYKVKVKKLRQGLKALGN